MKINYTFQFKNHFIEFDTNTSYYIVELNTTCFDEYWQENSYLNESFKDKYSCTRRTNYYILLNEILNKKENEIAYPIIDWINNQGVKISQGRHRIRAIIDSGIDSIQLAIKKDDYIYFNNIFKNVIIKEFEVKNDFSIIEKNPNKE